jgi:hypothetical protein
MLRLEMRQTPIVITNSDPPPRRSKAGGRRLWIGLSAAVVALVILVAGIGGIVWMVGWLNDNINAPGPPPTGSGVCGSADAVNIQLVFADGHTVQACTRDRPACPNQTATGSINGQTSSFSGFGFGNQLRSSSRRFIFSVSFDATLPAEAPEQTVQIDPQVFLPGPPGTGRSSNGMLSAAVVHISPRDPDEDGFTATSGSATVSSSHGVARGRIDGHFNVGPPRPDRPAPTPTTESPVSVTGAFACNH